MEWNKTNVRIQVKPKLNKFHIFLHFHISPPKKYPNCWIARGGRCVYVFLFYVCDRLLSRLNGCGCHLSHVPKSFSLNLTLLEQRKDNERESEKKQSLWEHILCLLVCFTNEFPTMRLYIIFNCPSFARLSQRILKFSWMTSIRSYLRIFRLYNCKNDTNRWWAKMETDCTNKLRVRALI